MKYFVASHANDYEIVSYDKPVDYIKIFVDDLDCRRLSDTWVPVPVFRTSAYEHAKARPADFPYFASHALVMRRTAVDILGDLIAEDCEILPLSTDDNVELFVINALRHIEMDYDRSVVMYLTGTKIPLLVHKYVFKKEKVDGIHLFRPQQRGGDTIVSEAFYDLYTAAKLTGLLFNEVTVE